MHLVLQLVQFRRIKLPELVIPICESKDHKIESHYIKGDCQGRRLPNCDEDDENVDPHDEGQNEEETRENVDSSEESLTKVVETSTKRTTEEPEEKNDTEILKRKSTVGSGKAKREKVRN